MLAISRRRTAACRAALLLSALALAPGAGAEVSASGPGGFLTRDSVLVNGGPLQAYQRFIDIRAWWDAAHTYSQDSRNLHLEPKAGGCWCETLPQAGSVEHMRVVLVLPARELHLQGGLGPLQEMGASGVMTVKFEAKAEQTLVSLSYAVSGFLPGKGLGEMAAPVDQVLQAQLARYQKLFGST